MIIIEGPEGQRLVEEGKAYTLGPGERMAGSTGPRKRNGYLALIANFFGMELADFIAFAARALKIPPCPSCQLRDQILRRIGELGIRRALWMLIETFKRQEGKEIKWNQVPNLLKLIGKVPEIKKEH